MRIDEAWNRIRNFARRVHFGCEDPAGKNELADRGAGREYRPMFLGSWRFSGTGRKVRDRPFAIARDARF